MVMHLLMSLSLKKSQHVSVLREGPYDHHIDAKCSVKSRVLLGKMFLLP